MPSIRGKNMLFSNKNLFLWRSWSDYKNQSKKGTGNWKVELSMSGSSIWRVNLKMIQIISCPGCERTQSGVQNIQGLGGMGPSARGGPRAGRCPWWPDLGDPGERSPCRWAAGGCAQWLLFTNWQRNISGLSLLAWQEASLVHTSAVAAWQRRRKQQASLGCEELIM